MRNFPAAMRGIPAALALCLLFSVAIRAETLREALADKNVPLDAAKLKNLDRTITGGAEFDDASQFVIAYYLDDGSGAFRQPLFIDSYDRKTHSWTSASISGGGFQVSFMGMNMPGDECFGSVLEIHASKESFFLDTHINPSAGCLLVLSRDLKLRAALSGWYLARFDDDTVVHHLSEIHFAAVHPAELALYDWKTKRDIRLFPRKPFQKILLAHIARLREFYATHEEWCKRHNDACDPESFDSSLVGGVAIDDRSDALAFTISFDTIQEFPGDEQRPSGPARVVYVYRHVDDEARMEYRELLWSDVQAKFGELPLTELLEPERLKQIFGN